MIKKLLLLVLFVNILLNALGQKTEISGKITEKKTGDPIPYANIIFPGTYVGTTSDINGNYRLITSKPTNTLEVSAIGFVKQVVPIQIK